MVIKRIPSYIKDTTDFLLKLLSVRVSPGSLLLTLDVRALYANIPHETGTQACRKLLNTRDILEPPTGDIIKLITLMLKRNNFCFNNEHYIQRKGTAMGTCMAPSYVNIHVFMDDLERRILASLDRVPTMWWRYIDDVFAMATWQRTLDHFSGWD